ncbi:hypothetical protein [Streptomyces sp. MB09-02B]|uniref:hypothetical protein n=1 Tax=Streptomyces sp. MB09-02B TaxID=3028667 RepID=UPI0029B16C5D|nr:hypothetical protein [Streptomyces sp. MB09-02B]MDX3641766.1 hypothetical protein [Streptomyces sp. MB09-02B]
MRARTERPTAPTDGPSGPHAAVAVRRVAQVTATVRRVAHVTAAVRFRARITAAVRFGAHVTAPVSSGAHAGACISFHPDAVSRSCSGGRPPRPAFRHPQEGREARVERSAALRALGPEERRGWL